MSWASEVSSLFRFSSMSGFEGMVKARSPTCSLFFSNSRSHDRSIRKDHESQKEKSMESTEEKILAKLKSAPSRLLSFKQLIRMLDLESDQRHELRMTLHDMVKSGTLIKLKGNRYTLPPESQLVIGRLSTHRDGYGFVIPEKRYPSWKETCSFRRGTCRMPWTETGSWSSVEESRRGNRC